MKLSLDSLKNTSAWGEIKLPRYDVEKVTENTHKSPVWLHFGAGNIFRGFIASLQQSLLDQGLSKTGIIAADTFDYEIIDKIFRAHDNLTVSASLLPDGSVESEVIASVCEALKADITDEAEMARFYEIAKSPSLQMISFTITEKGYAVKNTQGELTPLVVSDITEGPEHARHAMSFVTELMLERYKAGKLPVALVSMDNCSHNGEKLKSSVMTIANGWVENGFADKGFVDYLNDESVVGFPWSMIDKITPRPSEKVEAILSEAGLEEMSPIITSKKTFIAPFVNAEKPQYLVIEDSFPNSRPALEKAGVYMTDRDTVNNVERMKVTTCLNPLHTALAVYGCLLGYTLICEEMKDEDLVKLVRKLGYDEGLPVVTDPGILSPKAFIDEVINERLPNPFMPDAPQRIATDTSQKVGIRFGETIKSYEANGDVEKLTAVPLAIAGWLRYLLGVDDNGEAMEISSDPLKDELKAHLTGIELGKPETVGDKLDSILSNSEIFGTDLVRNGLSKKITEIFLKEVSGTGAVRATLKEYLG
ncbi:MAG: mannitol dehydrogenase family protein [Oscillospiraceae bacterium]|nr:mannitol dehydrogenase family protein [Oscillospiraceae bacterium]